MVTVLDDDAAQGDPFLMSVASVRWLALRRKLVKLSEHSVGNEVGF